MCMWAAWVCVSDTNNAHTCREKHTPRDPTVPRNIKIHSTVASWCHILFIMHACWLHAKKSAVVLVHRHKHHIVSPMLTAFLGWILYVHLLTACLYKCQSECKDAWDAILGSPNNPCHPPKGALSLPLSPVASHDDSSGCHPSIMMIHPWLLPAHGSSLTKLIVWHVKHTSA